MSEFWDGHAKKIDRERFRDHAQYLWAPENFPYEKLTRFIYDTVWITAFGERRTLSDWGSSKGNDENRPSQID
jgi:hypothetical protein